VDAAPANDAKGVSIGAWPDASVLARSATCRRGANGAPDAASRASSVPGPVQRAAASGRVSSCRSADCGASPA
jgi:hypothetical protein